MRREGCESGHGRGKKGSPEYVMDASSTICYATYTGLQWDVLDITTLCNCNSGKDHMKLAYRVGEGDRKGGEEGGESGAVITPAMDHTMSMQPASMMGPLTQQMNHLSLGTTGIVAWCNRLPYMTAAAAAAPMQGTYIPQYTPVPPTAVPVEGVVTDASPQTVAPSSQEVAGQQQQIQVDSAADHVPAYSYQSNAEEDMVTPRTRCSVSINQYQPTRGGAKPTYKKRPDVARATQPIRAAGLQDEVLTAHYHLRPSDVIRSNSVQCAAPSIEQSNSNSKAVNTAECGGWSKKESTSCVERYKLQELRARSFGVKQQADPNEKVRRRLGYQPVVKASAN
ncbi:hypothetical protein INR49_027472 [Caranx melampygus]|nr:hypothetical protein INR49_027472 [Caranx melampygus]